jgi:hypothetical protein
MKSRNPSKMARRAKKNSKLKQNKHEKLKRKKLTKLKNSP